MTSFNKYLQCKWITMTLEQQYSLRTLGSVIHSIWYVIGPEKKIKHLNSESLTIVEPLRLFITGGTGVGKSYLAKILTTFFN